VPKLDRFEKAAGKVFRDTQTELLLEATTRFKTDAALREAELRARQGLGPDDDLTPEQLIEVRLFFVVPPFLAHFRHECPKRHMVSTAMKLNEQYVLSPDYFVYVAPPSAESLARLEVVRRQMESLDEASPEYETLVVEEGKLLRSRLFVLLTEPAEGDERVQGAELHKVPAGRFGFVYRSGKCHCAATGQSRVGKLVDAHERPPLHGKESR
jgi:hypothetical protein